MSKNPVFNLKTGADSDIFISREVTSNGENSGKVLKRDGVYRFPYLTRMTGNSIKGTTENIESNELRKGRVNSAPRKGNSSSDGSLDIELSPETFDDQLEAVFRGKWTPWESDTNSISNKDGNAYQKGYFATKCGTNGSRKLIDDGTGEGDAKGLISCAEGCVVHELNPSDNDVKYSFLKKFGGAAGEDLYQEFAHMAVNSVSLDVAINEIITGSFEFMGGNNPEMLSTEAIKTELDGRLIDNTGANFVDNLPEKASGTLQYTAREGFLYINGRQIEYASSLSFSLDNGLEKKYAIFVPNAISSTPLALDITGELTVYLVKDGSDQIFNEAVRDETVEILFCFQNKLENPDALYVFQLFKNKFTDNSVNLNGEDTVDVSLPFSNFDEEACRVFRIIKPRFTGAEVQDGDADGELDTVVLLPNIALSETTDLTQVHLTGKIDGVDATATLGLDVATPVLTLEESSENYMLVTAEFVPVTKTDKEQILEITAEWNGETVVQSFTIPAMD